MTESGFNVHLNALHMNLCFIGFLCNFGFQYNIEHVFRLKTCHRPLISLRNSRFSTSVRRFEQVIMEQSHVQYKAYI
ncbi:hypothetical protein GJ496_008289 [Pomphorhynchus laevis]|nr:hypothetical protein GJ496_008289 [Pomphorhynchus laevis]